MLTNILACEGPKPRHRELQARGGKSAVQGNSKGATETAAATVQNHGSRSFETGPREVLGKDTEAHRLHWGALPAGTAAALQLGLKDPGAHLELKCLAGLLDMLYHGNLEGCQAGYTCSTEETTDSQPQPQAHHIALCLVAYLIMERERFERGMTWRRFKRRLILKKPHTPLPALERLRMAA